MTRKDIAIIQRAVERAPQCWTLDGWDAEQWQAFARTQPADEHDEALLISGTLQLLNQADTAPHALPCRPADAARLRASLPTQDEWDTAQRVLAWLEEYAQRHGAAFATLGDPTGTEAMEKLTWTRNECNPDLDYFVETLTAEDVRSDGQV